MTSVTKLCMVGQDPPGGWSPTASEVGAGGIIATGSALLEPRRSTPLVSNQDSWSGEKGGWDAIIRCNQGS